MYIAVELNLAGIGDQGPEAGSCTPVFRVVFRLRDVILMLGHKMV
jgi:hypothetical protein